MRVALTAKYGNGMRGNQRKTGRKAGNWTNLGIWRMATGRSAQLNILACMLLTIAILVQDSRASAQEQAQSSELVVAAAADLSSVLKEIAGGYEKQTGVQVKLSFGASGGLTQQIQNGAPFDLFFSADMGYPRRLIASGDADRASLYEYAVGKLVLWVPASSALDVEHKGLQALLDPSVRKIAIANPEFAPYGLAAVAALTRAGLYDRLSDELVLGENVSQAAQFVESGNAQAGLVALAHAVAPGMSEKGRYWIVPAEYYPPLAQGVVVLAHSQHKSETQHFLQYIRSKEARRLFESYGFAAP
jgi:molybdate transport system substrate-binding protein